MCDKIQDLTFQPQNIQRNNLRSKLSKTNIKEELKEKIKLLKLNEINLDLNNIRKLRTHEWKKFDLVSTSISATSLVLI